jgi:hypothetical protein
MVSAKKEQNIYPRIAASDEWKIGRVGITALVRKNKFSTWSKSRYRSTACSGRDLRVGAQYKDAVETRLIGKLAGINLKGGPVLRLAHAVLHPIALRCAEL